MVDTQHILLYATPEHPCSYLPHRSARSIFLDPLIKPTAYLYQQLSDQGFRRSGKHIYRPHCSQCNRCKSSRIRVNDFVPNRSQRKTLNRNQDLVEQSMPAQFSHEVYQLYARYISQRHHDGDMYPPSQVQFENFLCLQPVSSCHFVGYYLQQQLIAVEVVDQLEQGYSAIYSFFSLDLPRRSLGSYIILRQIERARNRGMPYV
jgi:arginyl-tRNA--protein-N-Asp/Glu arginylyltransferase